MMYLYKKARMVGLMLLLSGLSPKPSDAQILINEGFTNIPASGWAQQNLSAPIGATNWFQGNATVFNANSGPANSYAAANWQNVSGDNTISNWLFTPTVAIANGNVFTFYARSAGTYADRLQLTMSTNGTSVNVGSTNTSVGDFTSLLVDINPSLTATGFPSTWTAYSVTVSGVPTPTTGRFAFRYFVANGGLGSNSNYIGVDEVLYGTPCGGVPIPGNTLCSVSSSCINIPFTLSLQNQPSGMGIGYQWQSSSSALGPWTNITAATNPSFTTTLSSSTYYRANVACGANSAFSTPLLVTVNAPSACLCIPASSDCSQNDRIENVTFGSNLNNTSVCSANGYADYTSSVPTTNVIIGNPNPIQVTVGPGGSENVGVWIDYDRSGSFDSTEYTYVGNGNGVSISGNILIPPSLTTGLYRMRVRARYVSPITANSACTAYTYGETEDYSINLIPCIPGSITLQTTNKTVSCSGNTSFNVAASGSFLNYQWQYRNSVSGVWRFLSNGVQYNGVNTNNLTITGASDSMNGFQYRAIIAGPCTTSDFTTPDTLTVTQLSATVSPATSTICTGSVQQLSVTNIPTQVPATSSFSSGIINLAIPDNNLAGVTSTIPVSLPAGAGAITRIDVKFTLPHNWPGDIVMALKSPSGAIINLDYFLSGTGGTGAGTGFTNTVISSSPAITATLGSSTSPFTGIFKADAWFGPAAGPTGFAPTATNFSAVFPSTNANGNWTLAVYDGGPGDIGTLTTWSMDISYLSGIPATGVWGSISSNNIFSDSLATVPYTGNALSTVFVKPSTTANYNVVVRTPSCVSGTTTIPVNVNLPIVGTSAISNKSVCSGGNTSFTASLPTSGSVISHQWKLSTDDGSTFSNIANSALYNDVNSATLTVHGATASMNRYKYMDSLYVTGCNTFTRSNIASLSVNPNPTVSINASLLELYPGLNTTISCNVSQTNITEYNWFKNGTMITGANSKTIVENIDGLGTYSLIVKDINGCVGSSLPLEIKETANDILFIYPSPNTGQFQVRFYSLKGNNPLPRVLNVFNSKGEKVYSKTYTVIQPYSRLDINLTNQGKGVFSVELSDANGKKLKTGRVIIL